MSALSSRTLSSPIGKLYYVTSGDVVLGLNLTGIDSILAGLNLQGQKVKILRESTPSQATRALKDYFDGDLMALDSLKVSQSGGPFLQKAWAQMRKIKAGKTITYADLAEKAGSPAAVRAAGSACAKNKIAIIVACHRIINSSGAIGAYAYGSEKKIWLLRHEGFLP